MTAAPEKRAVLIKGPYLNSRVYFTALPERLDGLLEKASDLFQVPADCVPQLYVACSSSVGVANSEQRGALLMPDAMPFLRDRELLTLRWISKNSPSRSANASVQWNISTPSSESKCVPFSGWRGPQARAAHVARVLERERSQGEESAGDPTKPEVNRPSPNLKPITKVADVLLTPPSSSPTNSPDAVSEPQHLETPVSPTPQRTRDAPKPLVWKNPQSKMGAAISDPVDKQEVSSSFSLGALCARLNPFSRPVNANSEEQVSTPNKEVFRPLQNETRAFPESKVAAKPMRSLDLDHVQGASAFEIMTQLVAALREHPCALQLRSPITEDFRRFCEKRGRITELSVIISRVNKREYSAYPLTQFAKDLEKYLDNVVTYYGNHSRQANAAVGLGRFAETLLRELSKHRAMDRRSLPVNQKALPSSNSASGKPELVKIGDPASSYNKFSREKQERIVTTAGSQPSGSAPSTSDTKSDGSQRGNVPAVTIPNDSEHDFDRRSPSLPETSGKEPADTGTFPDTISYSKPANDKNLATGTAGKKHTTSNPPQPLAKRTRRSSRFRA
ncbi:hypothetical protein MYAM1_000394 [Malassezia yamatoensis]|uniref:Bromo domain-containing protein n=1 Tax=Malassezia yamatoensis TaxID=253288 RepID=A0AAJ6CFY5_9BASI|nr:hypothetical protein MYAM1_000394 [Malassezia yamatoensis]